MLYEFIYIHVKMYTHTYVMYVHSLFYITLLYTYLRLDPRENRPISRIFSHRIQMAQHRLGPCRVVKITIDALPVHW
jgi:hypothetical protein